MVVIKLNCFYDYFYYYYCSLAVTTVATSLLEMLSCFLVQSQLPSFLEASAEYTVGTQCMLSAFVFKRKHLLK